MSKLCKKKKKKRQDTRRVQEQRDKSSSDGDYNTDTEGEENVKQVVKVKWPGTSSKANKRGVRIVNEGRMVDGDTNSLLTLTHH